MSALSMGKVANRAGIGVETVRFYERRRLIEEPTGTASQVFAFYADGDSGLQFQTIVTSFIDMCFYFLHERLATSAGLPATDWIVLINNSLYCGIRSPGRIVQQVKE